MVQVRKNFSDGSRRAFRRVVNGGLLALLVMAVAPGVSAATGQPVRILMLGDSLTSGHGLIKGGSLPDRLQEALQKAAPGSQVLNAGVSGDTTAGGRSRLAWSLVAQPDALIVALGANDGLRGLAPEQTYANLNAILSAAKKAGLPVLLAGMRAPPNLGPEYGDAFNAVFPRLAAEHNVALYPFLLENVVARPELNQDDGIHPNPKGVAVIVNNMLPFVLKLIEQAGQ
jgi:acyl-CoA thioesterase-1